MKMISAKIARKREERAFETRPAPRPQGPPFFADDLDCMGEAWMGLLEEEDTLSSMQDWEQK
jgi:hypothetical protein